MKEKLQYDCLTFNQNNKDLVFFKVKAKDLLEFASVARKTYETPEGYQRMFSEYRKKAIAKYINNGNIVPNSILISFDKAKLNKEKNIISFEKKANTAWIIDGQHRVLGAYAADIEIELPVIAMINASTEEQILQFVTINREAKGVPSSLYIDLLGRLPRDLSPKEVAQNRASDIADRLNENAYSPFYNRIATISSPKAGQISKSNFVKKLEPLIVPERGRLNDFTMQEQVKIIDNYFKAIEKAFPQELKKDRPIFYQTIGFGAFMKAFELIFNTIVNKTCGGFEVENIVNLLNLFSLDLQTNISLWNQYGTGEKAETAASNEIKTYIQQINSQSEWKSSIRL